MAATAVSYNQDALLTNTSNLYYEKGKVFDNVFESCDLLKAMRRKAKREVVGGAKIQVNLMYGHNEAGDSYSRYEQQNVAPQDGMTSAYFDWRQYGFPLSIDGLSEFQNQGPSKIQSLLGEKIEQLSMSFSERLNKDLLDVANYTISSEATGNSGKNILGLPAIMQKDPDGAGTLGGINQLTQTWWNNKVKDASDTSTGATFKRELNSLYNSCSRGAGGAPDLILMDQGTYENYIFSLQDQMRYTSTKSADIGFRSLMLNNAEVIWDSYVPDMDAGTNSTPGTALSDGTVFMINTKFLNLVIGKGKDFAPTPFRTPVDQDARTQLWLLYAQLVTSNRRKQGLMHDVVVAMT